MTVSTDDPSWQWDDLDHSRAAPLLEGHLPALAHSRLEPLGHGEFCLAFGMGSQIVRVARHPDAPSALRREACVLATIANQLPLPVPRPTYFQANGCPPFSVHEAITGTALTAEGWMSMQPGARERAASDLAAFLRVLHTLPTNFGVQCGLPRLEMREYARTIQKAASRSLYPLLDQRTGRSLDAALARWSEPAGDDPRPLALIHCDIAPGHLLCDQSSGYLTGIIDFGDLAVGDPARDFIFIYEDYGPELLDDVLRHYTDPDTSSLLPRIHQWYLLEAVAWSLDMLAAQRSDELKKGLAEITRELAAASP